jgi:hypothetical protein
MREVLEYALEPEVTPAVTLGGVGDSGGAHA